MKHTMFLAGALETIVINMSKLAVSVVTSVKGRDPLASEVLHWLCVFNLSYCHLSCTYRLLNWYSIYLLFA